MSGLTSPIAQEMLDDARAEVLFPLKDVNAAIKEAIGPRRNVRRIILAAPHSANAVCCIQLVTNGIIAPSHVVTPEEAEAVKILCGEYVGYHSGVFSVICDQSPRAILEAFVSAHLLHGWTLDSRTDTEVRLWKEA